MTDAELRRALLDWYDENRRDLPWRARPGEAPDPYRVWLSEVMLQQTRVETVRPYFERWLQRFPTIDALAAASEDEVLKAWEGLGYYSRARNLHRAVREVVGSYNGEVPADSSAFRALPGVGRYTAGAVLSIAFGLSEPVVDGNVRRVFARLLDAPDPGDATLWEMAERLVIGERPGDLNQALMELGAMVCTPRSPDCAGCPVAGACRARAAGTQLTRPAPRRRGPLPLEEESVAVVVDRGEMLLVRRPARGRLAGLWSFPSARLEPGEAAGAGAVRAVAGLVDGPLEDAEPLPVVEHVFTHVRVRYHPVVFTLAGHRTGAEVSELRWVDGEALRALALPRAQRRIAALLEQTDLAASIPPA